MAVLETCPRSMNKLHPEAAKRPWSSDWAHQPGTWEPFLTTGHRHGPRAGGDQPKELYKGPTPTTSLPTSPTTDLSGAARLL